MGIPMACVRWETPVLLTVESLPPKQCLAQRGCSVFVQGIINNSTGISREQERSQPRDACLPDVASSFVKWELK